MKTTRNITRILMCCLCASLILSLNFFTAPANAATASEFDFSAEDSIDKYDSYKKLDRELPNGVTVSYVDAAMMNTINNTNPDVYKPSLYRYGAYLRSPDDVQRYGFYNLNWNRTKTTMCNNTLTIYADPGVKFDVTDPDGNSVVNTSGIQDRSLVEYYNKSTDYGNNVYYIELVPGVAGKGQYMVTFSTDSNDTQPHYSFWYGAPLTRKGTKTIGDFALDVSAPNRSSAAFPLSVYSGIPERAWVNTATIKKVSVSGASYASSVNINVTPPGATTGIGAQNAASSTLVFNDTPCSAGITHDARGTYKVYISNISWYSGTRVATYLYEGRLSVEYIYAFGA